MRPWTSGELEALRILGPVLGGRGCAEAFERSRKSVERKAAQIGVSLRRRNHGGISGVSLSATVRKRVETILDEYVCPACGKAPIGVRSTGLCARCHYRALVAVHEEEIARLDGQRELWAARSKLQRRRRELRKVGGIHSRGKGQ